MASNAEKFLIDMSDASLAKSKLAADSFFKMRETSALKDVFRLYAEKSPILPLEIFWAYVEDNLFQRSAMINFEILELVLRLCTEGDLVQKLRAEKCLKSFFLTYRGLSKYRKIIGVSKYIESWDKKPRDYFIQLCTRENLLGLSKLIFKTSFYPKNDFVAEYALAYLGCEGAPQFVRRVVYSKNLDREVRLKYLKLGLLKKYISSDRNLSELECRPLDCLSLKKIPESSDFITWDKEWRKIYILSYSPHNLEDKFKFIQLFSSIDATEITLEIKNRAEIILTLLNDQEILYIYKQFSQNGSAGQLSEFVLTNSNQHFHLRYWKVVFQIAELADLIVLFDKMSSMVPLDQAEVEYVVSKGPHLLWIYLQSPYCHLYNNINDILKLFSRDQVSSMNRVIVFIQLRKKEVPNDWLNTILDVVLKDIDSFTLNEWFEFLRLFTFNELVTIDLINKIDHEESLAKRKSILCLLALSACNQNINSNEILERLSQISLPDWTKFIDDYPGRAYKLVRSMMHLKTNINFFSQVYEQLITAHYQRPDLRENSYVLLLEKPLAGSTIPRHILSETLYFAQTRNTNSDLFLSSYSGLLSIPESLLFLLDKGPSSSQARKYE